MAIAWFFLVVLPLLLMPALLFWNPGPMFRNYKTNEALDKTIKECLDSGVKNVEVESHHCIAEFNNGYTIRFWSANKYYAYAQSGVVTTDKSKIVYWSDSMPRRFTVKRLYKMTEAKAFD